MSGVKIEAVDHSEIETVEFAEESDPELIEGHEPGPSNALSLPNNPGTSSKFLKFVAISFMQSDVRLSGITSLKNIFMKIFQEKFSPEMNGLIRRFL